MPIKARTSYPGGIDKKNYINSLILKYKEKYKEFYFSEEQISIPINVAVLLVSTVIESTDVLEKKILKIKFLRKLVQDVSFKPEKMLNAYSYYMHLYCFIQGVKSASLLFLERMEIRFPDENEKNYLNFTKEMACEVVLDVTEATEGLIKILQGQENVALANLSPQAQENIVPVNLPPVKRVTFFKNPIVLGKRQKEGVSPPNSGNDPGQSHKRSKFGEH